MNFLFCDMIRKQHEYELIRANNVHYRTMFLLMLNVLIGTLLVVELSCGDTLHGLSLCVALVLVVASTVILAIVAYLASYRDVAYATGYVKFHGEQVEYYQNQNIKVLDDDVDKAVIISYCNRLAEAQEFNSKLNERRYRITRIASLLTCGSVLAVAIFMVVKVVSQ